MMAIVADSFMVFDVESVGLHGEGFAVAYVVIDHAGEPIVTGAYHCDPRCAAGSAADREWVAANVTVSPFGKMGYPVDVRDEFWRAWVFARERGATLWADCCWPVEARFLAACVDDKPKSRRWDGPYPLHDVATLRFAAGLDPLDYSERLPEELPAHNPLADARQSARLLVEALDRIGRSWPRG
jgi:hypothetical protein